MGLDSPGPSPRPMMHIAYSPKFIHLLPISAKFTFFGLTYVFASPYFDHGHASHVLDTPAYAK